MVKQAAPMDLFALEIRDEPENRQFILRAGEHRVRVEYERDMDRIFLTSLIVPKELELVGVGDVMLEKVLIHVDEKRWKVVPTHPAIKAYMRLHPSWQRLLLKGVQLR